MLGKKLADPDGVESGQKEQDGLGLLPLETRFVSGKKTIRIQGEPLAAWGGSEPVDGYEIHMGRTRLSTGASPLFKLSDHRLDGAVSKDGEVWGTYLHGLFDNISFTNHWLNRLRRKKGLPQQEENLPNRQESREEVYAFLSEWIREYVDMEKVKEIMGLRS